MTAGKSNNILKAQQTLCFFGANQFHTNVQVKTTR